MRLLYFSYGSNMSTPRLIARVPSARPLFTAILRGHHLAWHKQGRDGSAKCDAQRSGQPDHSVIGVVFSIDRGQKGILDRHEGLGEGYTDSQVWVETINGERIIASTYQAIRINARLRPFHWYKEHVLRGAREHCLPTTYLREIEAVAAIPDPLPHRHAKELAIYPDSE